VQVSIIIAAHERPISLERLLRSLAPQIVPGIHEVFIAENGTPVPSKGEAPGLAPIRLHDPRAGKCRVQNRAIAQARGEVIVCLDDDLVVSPGYVAEVEKFFSSHSEFAAMKGRILPAEDPIAKAGPAAAYMDLPIVDHGDEVIEVRGVIGANMAFRAAALRQAGPFDERLGPGAAGHEEETEMSQRLRRAGFRIGYAPRAIVYHEVDAARADRARFARIARERGFCRTLHEAHSPIKAGFDAAIAVIRLLVVRVSHVPIDRRARAEKRLAIALGILDGLRAQRGRKRSESGNSGE
jgi:glucosyl-dolichyl phosphate glucuronosyltransferase